MAVTRAVLIGTPCVVFAGACTAAALAIFDHLIDLPAAWDVAGTSTPPIIAGIFAAAALLILFPLGRFAANLIPARRRQSGSLAG